MKKLLVILDSDKKYGKRLCRFLSHRNQLDFELCLFETKDSFLSLLESKIIDFLIVDKKMFDDIASFLKTNNSSLLYSKINKIILLTDEKDSDKILRQNDFSDYLGHIEIVYKYQSAVNISSHLFNISVDKKEVKSEVQEVLLNNPELNDDEVLQIIDDYINKDGLFSEVKRDDDTELMRRESLKKEIFHSIRGLDVLSELLEDDSISEIMINGYRNIFVERNGKIVRYNKSFESNEMLLDIIQKIVASANRTVNMSSPVVDARLNDDSRVNVVLEPISLDGPILTIRRFPKSPLDMDKLIHLNALNDEIADFLRKAVISKNNILISGGTGAGKTTFLNSLSGFIPKDERIITIEDSAELKIQGIKNLVRLETRNENTDGEGEVSIRDLIRTALRMRPDRIIVGEVRGEEAIDMLTCFSVGQDGSMSTIHANSSEDALSRLETLVMLTSDNIPLQALRRQISSGVDLIIQLSRMHDSSRKLIEIREVLGISEGFIETNLLYEYREGDFRKCNEIKKDYKFRKAFMN